MSKRFCLLAASAFALTSLLFFLMSEGTVSAVYAVISFIFLALGVTRK